MIHLRDRMVAPEENFENLSRNLQGPSSNFRIEICRPKNRISGLGQVQHQGGICDFLKEGESRLTRQLPLCLSSRRCGPSLGLGRRTIAGPSPHEMVMVEGWLRAIVREKTRCGIVLVGGVGGWVSPRGKRGGRRSGRAGGDGEEVVVPVAAFSMLWPLVSGPRYSAFTLPF